MARLNPRAAARQMAQYGVISRYQAIRLDGHTPGEIDGMVYRGDQEIVFCGVYRQTGAPIPQEQRAMAAALRCGPDAWISGPFVLGLFGVEGFSRRDNFVVVVPSGRRVSNVPFPVHARDVAPEDRASWERMPIVVPDRASLDCVEGRPLRDLQTMVDSMKWAGHTSSEGLVTLCKRYPNHPGSKTLWHHLENGAFAQESHGERDFAGLFVGYDPSPEYQVWITPTLRPDAYWRDIAMAMEYLGEEHHAYVGKTKGSAGAVARAKDSKRHRAMEARGIHVEYITKEDLKHPQATRARLIAVREALLRSRRFRGELP